jgi:type I restriction enzyme M protein
MPLKKSQPFSSVRQPCDESCGGVDSSKYEHYVLTPLFRKYVSDKYVDEAVALIEVPKGGGFADIRAGRIPIRNDEPTGARPVHRFRSVC